MVIGLLEYTIMGKDNVLCACPEALDMPRLGRFFEESAWFGVLKF